MADQKEAGKPAEPIVRGVMPYRVPMADVDAYGVVYYANFFVMFERARTELFRSVGIDYPRILRERQVMMPVIEAGCRYIAPVVYGDLIGVEASVTNILSKGVRFDYRILREDTVLAYGYTRHVFIDPQGRPVNFGTEVLDILKSHLKSGGEGGDRDVSGKLKKLIAERTGEHIRNEEKVEGNT